MARASIAFAVVVATVVIAISPSAAGAPERRAPAVGLADSQPLTVRGVHFLRRERVIVSVLVYGRGRGTRSVTATSAGTFSARFDALSVGACDAYVLRAVGARGSSARLNRQLPPCGAAP